MPAFVYLLKLPEKQSRATSIYAILPMVLTSGFFYNRGNYIDWTLGIKCAIGGAMGAIIGSLILKKVSGRILQITFVMFLIYMGIKMILS